MHRHCRNIEIGCVPFNLLEAWVWIQMEKWNILWADDEAWLPPDENVLSRERLPHGFHKVITHDTDEEYLQEWVEVAAKAFIPSRLRSDTMVMLAGQIRAALPL